MMIVILRKATKHKRFQYFFFLFIDVQEQRRRTGHSKFTRASFYFSVFSIRSLLIRAKSLAKFQV